MSKSYIRRGEEVLEIDASPEPDYDALREEAMMSDEEYEWLEKLRKMECPVCKNHRMEYSVSSGEFFEGKEIYNCKSCGMSFLMIDGALKELEFIKGRIRVKE
jgi:DNA-directed RNA polymerase subunit M/transcription elongation factor TFIIS